MSKPPAKVYERRIETLKRRRDFLDKRVTDYYGKDMSRDLAEASALHWALGVVEANYEQAVDMIRAEQQIKEDRDV